MIIAGLDVATHLGVAIYSEGFIVHRETLFFPASEGSKANSPTRFTRYARYAAAIEDLLTQWAVSHVFIEGYGYANPYTLATLVELGAMVRQVLHESAAPWEEVPPPTLKKFLTGRGNAKKDEILMTVYKRFRIECRTHDEADAVGLAFFGAARLGLEVPLPQAQIAVATGLDKRKQPAQTRKRGKTQEES